MTFIYYLLEIGSIICVGHVLVSCLALVRLKLGCNQIKVLTIVTFSGKHLIQQTIWDSRLQVWFAERHAQTLAGICKEGKYWL